MNPQAAFEFSLDFGTSKPIVVEPSTAQVSSDAGLLLFRQLDEQLGATERLAAALARGPDSLPRRQWLGRAANVRRV